MKTVKTITSVIIGLGVAIAMSGCSTIEVVTGGDMASTDHSLVDASKNVSKVVPAKFTEGKSYVVYIAENRETGYYNHPSALYEVVDGKVVLAGLIKERPGRMVMEVEPGKHTYLQKSSCGVYTITIDVKEGYGYYISKNKRSLGKPSLMSYCRSQGRFSFMGYIDEVNIYSNYKNYALVSKNIAYANEIVANTSLQSQYESFMEDIDDVQEGRRNLIHREVGADLGFEVGSRL